MLSSVRSAVIRDVEGQPIDVEVHVSHGLPAYSVVGLPDASGRESKERVRAALLSSAQQFPLERITVNLAPASVRKQGSGLELAIALALLVASARLPEAALERTGVIGELGLDGAIRPVPGCLALVDSLVRAGASHVIVPECSAREAQLVHGVEVRPAVTLLQTIDCLTGESVWPPIPSSKVNGDGRGDEHDLADVRGLHHARLALEVAASGSHHLLLVGPPGAGKTMLARRLPTILPDLTAGEALEVARIRSAAGEPVTRLPARRPFRAPHHSCSTSALVGGGHPRPRPGEITRAHRGTLFLDELAEFPPSVLDALRQPLEDRCVSIARRDGTATYPTDILLVACANPCPCGRGGVACVCSEDRQARYRQRISGPLLDRLDLRVTVTPPGPLATDGESSASVRARVAGAVERQEHRYADRPWSRNAHVPPRDDVGIDPAAADALHELERTLPISARGAARIVRVARTLADLGDRSRVRSNDVTLAAAMREDGLG